MSRAAATLVVIALFAQPGAVRANAPDPKALDAIRAYISALSRQDAAGAFALLTPAQQHYFGNARNFASNLTATQYRILSFSFARETARNPNLVEVDVAQRVSYLDATTEHTAAANVIEAYFALRRDGRWGVKELYQPWKSYAPQATGRSGGLVVIVDRIEFFDQRVRVVCTLRNLGKKPLQVLPLLKSTLRLGAGEYAAIDTDDFALNDREFFEGVRIYPEHQAVGYINFGLTERVDAGTIATVSVGPAVEDGSSAPVSVSVGPIKLDKL